MKLLELKRRIKTIALLLLFICISKNSYAQILFESEGENLIPTGTFEVKTILGNGNPMVNASNGAILSLSPEATVTFTVNSVLGGPYKLKILHFNGGDPQDIDLTLNTETSLVTLGPSNWVGAGIAQASNFNLNLEAGDNTITLKASTVGFWIDKLSIEAYKNYYISASGNDSGNGDSNNPWKSLTKVSAAANKLSEGGIIEPGDKLLFKRGDTFEGNLILKCSGSASNLIEIGAYGTGPKPIISGSGTTISGGDYFEAIKMINTSHVFVNNLWIKNDRVNPSRYTYGEFSSYGIQVIATQWGGVTTDLHFKNLKITDIYSISLPEASEFNSLNAAGILLNSDEYKVYTNGNPTLKVSITNVVIEDCYFENTGKAGIQSKHKGTIDENDPIYNRNENIVVRNNTFHQTGGSGVIFSKTYNGLIENNNFDQTGYSHVNKPKLAGRGSGAWVFSSHNILAQYNRSYGIRGPGDSYGMHIDFGNKDVIFQYNYSEDSQGGFCEILGSNFNSTYRFNVSVNDGFRDHHGNTIWISDYVGSDTPGITSQNNYIYNNTIFINSAYKPDITIEAKDTYIYNNIFKVLWNSGGEIGENVDINVDPGSSLSMSNNLFQGVIAASFKNNDSQSQTSNPMFINEGDDKEEGYDITPSSPAIDNGISFVEPIFPGAGTGIFSHITNVPTKDIFNNPVDIGNTTPNIGASNKYNTSISLGVNTIKKENQIKLKENPVKQDLRLQFSATEVAATITIHDIQGKLIFQKNKAKYSGLISIALPQNIKNGIYFAKITNAKETQKIQFILTR